VFDSLRKYVCMIINVLRKVIFLGQAHFEIVD
jgi:hypothetical protein